MRARSPVTVVERRCIVCEPIDAAPSRREDDEMPPLAEMQNIDLSDESDEIRDVADRLVAHHTEVSESTIRNLVAAEYRRLSNARLRDYIPVLVEHAVKQTLRTDKARLTVGTP
jgi:hypothetical protein